MPVLLLIAFVSGLLTIAAPCIWPLLPVVLSSSGLRGRWRPLGQTLGILLSFGTITLGISYAVHAVGLDASLLRTLAVVVLAVVGLTLVSERLATAVEAGISRLTGGVGWSARGDGFWMGFLSGLPLGVVWAPCAGPILATIAALAATREVGVEIVIVTAYYLAGIGLSLLACAYAGRWLIHVTGLLRRHAGGLQRLAGVMMLLTAGLVFFDLDTRVEAELLTRVPAYSTLLNAIEGNQRVTADLDRLRGTEPPLTLSAASRDDLFNQDEAAPELKGITRWLNLPGPDASLSLAQLRGKVVLIDFWTYTCINCIRTLDHVKGWYERYKDDGLVVIGVHSPEFAFERDTSNVQAAMERFGIRYPVAQDNDYATWKAYRNQYWPAEYLIDRQGRLRRAKFGEGRYDQTERAIRELLQQGGAPVSGALTATPDRTPRELSSPETYLGADDMTSYFPEGRLGEGDYTGLQPSQEMPLNAFVLGGDWSIQPEYAQTAKDSVLEYSFHARYVYLVMHAPGTGAGTVAVLLDGAAIPANRAGADVRDKTVTVDADRLYELAQLPNSDDRHVLRLELSPGIQLYAFTFG